MRVLITGATGFVGRAVVLRLRRDGHTPVAWVRNSGRARALLGREAEWAEAGGGDNALQQAMRGCEAVINLAGEPIIGKRWTAAQRRKLVDSRVQLTTQVVAAMEHCEPRPKVLVSASAVGYYGSRGDTELSESASPGKDFLATLCQDWEAAARRAEALGVRVVSPRIGLVLGHDGGMLAKLLPLFEAGLGGPLGDGKQIMPWIHLHDLVESIVQAITNTAFSGPYNACAPTPVDNATFTKSLAQAVGRSAPFTVPKVALQLALGKAATAAAASQRTVPQRLKDWNFAFSHPTLDTALAHLLDPNAVSITPLGPQTPTPMLDHPYITERRPSFVLQAQTDLPRDREAVFEFFCRAENLGLMTPTAMALKPVAPPPDRMDVDVTIDYTLSVAGVPLTWRTRIAKWDAPHNFIDTQEKGPYRAWWHEHHFETVGSATRMVDRVFYAPPMGPLGTVANALMIKRQLQHIFWYRASAITLRFGTS